MSKKITDKAKGRLTLQGTFTTCTECNVSETETIRSPDLIIPLAFSNEKLLSRLLSMSLEKPRKMGIKPQCRFKRLCDDGLGVNAKTGQSGRQRDRSDAMYPVLVYTKIASASNLLAEISKTICIRYG